MAQVAAVALPLQARWLRVLARGDEAMQAIGMVCSEHSSNRERAHLTVVANNGARLADGFQRPATAAKTLANGCGD